MDKKLLKILVCPICYRSLRFIESQCQLICKFDQVFFPILHGIPRLLQNRSRNISDHNKKKT